MHALHFDPQRLLALIVASAMAVLAAVALPSLDGLSLSSGSSGSAVETDAPAPVQAVPRWVADPMAPPALERVSPVPLR